MRRDWNWNRNRNRNRKEFECKVKYSGKETRRVHMPFDLSARVRRLLGYDRTDRNDRNKRLRESEDDDPPAMKKYCNVPNNFPKIMPKEEGFRTTPSSSQNVRFIPIVKENDSPSTSFANLRRSNLPRHSSPSTDDDVIIMSSSQDERERPKIFNGRDNSASCTCNLPCKAHRNFGLKNSRFSGLSSSKISHCNSPYNELLCFTQKSTKERKEFRDEEEDNNDDDVECLDVIQLQDNGSENSDVIEVPYDADIIVLKPKMDRKSCDSITRRSNIPKIKYKSIFKRDDKNHHSTYVMSSFPYMFKSPKSTIKPRSSFNNSSMMSRNSQLRLSHQAAAIEKSFCLDQKRSFLELIKRTMSTEGKKSNFAKHLHHLHQKSTEEEPLKNDIIDLTINLYSDKLSNGVTKKNKSIQLEKGIDNSCNTNQEQSDPELITSADESSTTSSVKLKRKNGLENYVKHNQFLHPSWLDNLNKKYEEISLHKEQEVIKIQEEKEEPELPCLTDEQEIRIDFAFRPNPPDETLVEKFNSSIRRRDIQTLNGLNWLNDEIINFYVNLIMERSQLKEGLPKVYSTNSFFLQRLMKDGHSSLKRWTRKVDIFSHDLMVIPVHLGVHWCMSIINFKEYTIKYYDSMGGNNMACCKALLKYLEDEKLDKKKETLNSSEWKLECVKDIPQQMNGSDCGMFSCMFAEYISRNVSISFSQKDMPYFRRKMVLEIIEGRLIM